MKSFISLISLVVISTTCSAQFVAKVQLKEPIEGLCSDDVFALFPGFDGQVEAECPVSNDTILARLNAMQFFTDNPKFKGKGMVGIYINCDGELVQCSTDMSTGNSELDEAIVEVFNNLGEWKSGKLNGKKVDSIRQFSFKIKKGVVKWG